MRIPVLIYTSVSFVAERTYIPQRAQLVLTPRCSSIPLFATHSIGLRGLSHFRMAAVPLTVDLAYRIRSARSYEHMDRAAEAGHTHGAEAWHRK